MPVLDGVRTKVDKRSTAYDYETYEVDRIPRARVRFVSLADAAALRPNSYDAVLFADVDLDSRGPAARAFWPCDAGCARPRCACPRDPRSPGALVLSGGRVD